MSRSATFARRAEAFLTQQAAQGLAAEGEALDLVQLLGEMMVVEARIFGAGQAQDGLAGTLRQAAVAGSAAVGVCQRRLPPLPQKSLPTVYVADAPGEQFCGAGTRPISP